MSKAANNASDYVNGFSDKAQTAVRTAITHPNKAVSDAAKNAVKAADDIIDAAKAAERYAERKVRNYPEILSDAEKRLREKNVVDAIWHLGTDQIRKENENAAQLMREDEQISQVAQAAAGAWGGPAGAAAFAAWKAYNESGGKVDFAVKAGVYAYVLSAGYADTDALPDGTVGEIAKKAATTGAVSGIAVAASGGTTKDALTAFVQSGGSVLVQSGQSYVKKEYVDTAAAEADVYCTARNWWDMCLCGELAKQCQTIRGKRSQSDDRLSNFSCDR